MAIVLEFDSREPRRGRSTPKLISALIDLHFAEPKDKKLHDCKACPLAQKTTRKCEEPGYGLDKKPRWSVDSRSRKYTFCPGKATWSPTVIKTFQQCKAAFFTGILPREGSFLDQSPEFVSVYPLFCEAWRERNYGRVWQDVNKFTDEVFKAIGKMFSGKK